MPQQHQQQGPPAPNCPAPPPVQPPVEELVQKKLNQIHQLDQQFDPNTSHLNLVLQASNQNQSGSSDPAYMTNNDNSLSESHAAILQDGDGDG